MWWKDTFGKKDEELFFPAFLRLNLVSYLFIFYNILYSANLQYFQNKENECKKSTTRIKEIDNFYLGK